MRQVIWTVAGIGLLGAASAISAAKPTVEPVRVYVTYVGVGAEFKDEAQKDREDSTKELTKQLAKRKGIAVVIDPEAADLELTVEEREYLVRAQDDKWCVLRVRLEFKGYSTVIEGSNNATWCWNGAAHRASQKVEDWVQDNGAKVLAARKQ